MPELRRARPALGTLVEIRLRHAADRAPPLAALEAAFAAIAAVHQAMSVHEPDSTLAQLNRSAHQAPVHLDADTAAVLHCALALAQASEGAFDPTVGGGLQAWGLLPGTAPPAGSSWRDLRWVDARTLAFARPLTLDLGGIAKGYAVDRAVAALHEAGVQEALVNAGGDLYALGRWRVAIRDPADPSLAWPLDLEDAALATSCAATSRRGVQDRRVCALMDPHSGAALGHDDSVSVQAPTAMLADALTKVLLFAKPARAADVLRHYGAQALRLPARPLFEALPC